MNKSVVVFIIALALALCTVPVFGAETEITYGVVLDSEGNGMAIDSISNKMPVDPYYNYIAYDKANTKPGQVVYTIATIDEDGEWISRKDYPLDIWIEDSELNVLIEIYNLNQKVTKLVYERR